MNMTSYFTLTFYFLMTILILVSHFNSLKSSIKPMVKDAIMEISREGGECNGK